MMSKKIKILRPVLLNGNIAGLTYLLLVIIPSDIKKPKIVRIKFITNMNLNEIDRHVLNKMNHALESLDDELTERSEGPEMPVLIILAQPRAGSTVLQQWLATCLHIGYVSNFLARYWGAPYIGSMLEAQLDQKKLPK